MALSILTVASHASNGGKNNPAPTVVFSCLGNVLPQGNNVTTAFQGDAPRINVACSNLTPGSTIQCWIYPTANPSGVTPLGNPCTVQKDGSCNITFETSGTCGQSQCNGGNQGGNCGGGDQGGNCGGGNQGGNCGGGTTSSNPPVYTIVVEDPKGNLISQPVNISVVTAFAINTQVGTLQ
jgi:hypothetical protein